MILLIAAVLRLWGLGQKSLWLDESVTVHNASAPYSVMIHNLKKFDVHPPLFQTVQWAWMRFGSTLDEVIAAINEHEYGNGASIYTQNGYWARKFKGDGFVRFPMAVTGIIAVWLTYLIARRLLGRTAGWIAACLMTVSSFHIYYSQEARLYALVTALFLAQIYILIRILHQRGRAHRGWWVAYGLAGLVSLYTYVLCILTIGALALAYLLVTWKRRRQLVALVIVHIAIALIFWPWVDVIQDITTDLKQKITEQDLRPRPNATQLSEGVASWSAVHLDWRSIRPTGAVLGAALLAVAAAGLLMRRSRRPAKILAVLFFAPLIGYMLLPMVRVHDYEPKHLIFLQPLLIIGLSGFRLPMRKFGVHAARPAVYLGLTLVLLSVWGLADYYSSDYQKENWRATYTQLRPKLAKDDAIVLDPDRIGHAFEYYAPNRAEKEFIHGLVVRGMTNVSPRRIWLITCDSPVSRPNPAVQQQIMNRGWQYTDGGIFPGRIGTISWTLFLPPGAQN